MALGNQLLPFNGLFYSNYFNLFLARHHKTSEVGFIRYSQSNSRLRKRTKEIEKTCGYRKV